MCQEPGRHPDTLSRLLTNTHTEHTGSTRNLAATPAHANTHHRVLTNVRMGYTWSTRTPVHSHTLRTAPWINTRMEHRGWARDLNAPYAHTTAYSKNHAQNLTVAPDSWLPTTHTHTTHTTAYSQTHARSIRDRPGTWPPPPHKQPHRVIG